jgi:KEOPS complex subunit Cgi121
MQVVEGTLTVDDVDTFVETLGEIGAEHDCTVQAFDARYVVDRHHLERALELADRAIDRGENVARDRGVEVLLYAAGRRQIDRALAMGVSEGAGPAVLLVAPTSDHRDADSDPDADADSDAAVAALESRLDLALEPTLGEYDDRLVREYFDVGDRELAATDATLPDLVHERVALLDVEK